MKVDKADGLRNMGNMVNISKRVWMYRLCKIYNINGFGKIVGLHKTSKLGYLGKIGNLGKLGGWG